MASCYAYAASFPKIFTIVNNTGGDLTTKAEPPYIIQNPCITPSPAEIADQNRQQYTANKWCILSIYPKDKQTRTCAVVVTSDEIKISHSPTCRYDYKIENSTITFLDFIPD